MKQYFIFLIFLFPFFCFSQIAKINDFTKQNSGGTDKQVNIVYPVISANNNSADNLISTSIIDTLTFSDVSLRKKPLDEIFNSLIAKGMTDLNYNVFFNANNILSLKINCTRCGAYCAETTMYFNFDLNSGKAITVDSIIMEEYF